MNEYEEELKLFRKHLERKILVRNRKIQILKKKHAVDEEQNDQYEELPDEEE